MKVPPRPIRGLILVAYPFPSQILVDGSGTMLFETAQVLEIAKLMKECVPTALCRLNVEFISHFLTLPLIPPFRYIKEIVSRRR